MYRTALAALLCTVVLSSCADLGWLLGDSEPSPAPKPAESVVLRQGELAKFGDDAELTLQPGEIGGVEFSITATCRMIVRVAGVEDAEKGFSVRVIRATDYAKLIAGEKVSCFATVDRVTDHTVDVVLDAGEYAAVVHNAENLLNSMRVRVTMLAQMQ